MFKLGSAVAAPNLQLTFILKITIIQTSVMVQN
jgi:hypothetical protein